MRVEKQCWLSNNPTLGARAALSARSSVRVAQIADKSVRATGAFCLWFTGGLDGNLSSDDARDSSSSYPRLQSHCRCPLKRRASLNADGENGLPHRVAQICNLPYRRIAFCGTPKVRMRWNISTLRRFQIGDTAECNSATILAGRVVPASNAV